MSEGLTVLSLAWGDVPTWIGSLLTGTSFAVAAFTYRSSVADRRRAQATLVSAWLVEAGGTCPITGAQLEVDTLFVRNSSDSAVSRVVVHHMQRSDGVAAGVSAWPAVGPQTTVSAPSRLGASELVPAWLYFVDSGGTSWVRTRAGKLDPLSRKESPTVEALVTGYF